MGYFGYVRGFATWRQGRANRKRARRLGNGGTLMEALFTVANGFNLALLVIGWSIRNELGHIRESIRDVKESANEAHKRIDGVLQN